VPACQSRRRGNEVPGTISSGKCCQGNGSRRGLGSGKHVGCGADAKFLPAAAVLIVVPGCRWLEWWQPYVGHGKTLFASAWMRGRHAHATTQYNNNNNNNNENNRNNNNNENTKNNKTYKSSNNNNTIITIITIIQIINNTNNNNNENYRNNRKS
jgi:hypothetical protein